MICRYECSIYHWDDNKEAYLHTTYRSHNYLTRSDKIDKGMTYNDKFIIRIPGKHNIYVGDKLMPGSCSAANPPAECFKIVTIRENFNGLNPHVYIEAVR